MACYITHLHLSALCRNTVNSHLAAIAFGLKLRNLEDTTKSFLVKKTLQGISKVTEGLPSRVQNPLTFSNLQKILPWLHLTSTSHFQRVTFKAIYLLMYFACLRAGEAVLSANPEHMLRIEQFPNLLSEDKHLLIKFSSFKHSKKFHVPSMLLHERQGDPMCPVTALKQYAQLRGVKPGPLFLTESGNAITRTVLAKNLKNILTLAGIDPTLFNTHSLRSGRATDLASANTSELTIKQTGRWQSNAYYRYVRPTTFVLPP